jgi:hypothetical protein
LSITTMQAGMPVPKNRLAGSPDQALDEAAAHQVAPDLELGVAAKQHAMRQHARATAGALE